MADKLLEALTAQVAEQLIQVLAPLQNENAPKAEVLHKKPLARWLGVSVQRIEDFQTKYDDFPHFPEFYGEQTGYPAKEVREWVAKHSIKLN